MAIHEFDMRDVEYLRHGDTPFLMRVYKPRGNGPFPLIVQIHGGAWCMHDRTRDKNVQEALAQNGFAVAALDFRLGRDGQYPLSMADINYAIRWIKAHAAELGTRADLIGAVGMSSGAHQAMLVAMRPNDERYNAIKLPEGSPEVDASLRAIALLWAPLNPLGRYRFAKNLQAGGNPPAWVEATLEHHHLYWKSEEDMAEGNPMLALERGEKVRTPPALWIQPINDLQHDYKDPESDFRGTEAPRFVNRYRKAGGLIDLHYFDAPNNFTTSNGRSQDSLRAYSMLANFFRKTIPVAIG